MSVLRTFIWTLALLSVGFSIALAKTNYAYVANSTTNTVAAVDTAKGIVVKTIAVGVNPQIVVVNQAGKFAYVANTGSNNVSVISTGSNKVTTTIPVGNSPIGVAFDPDGKTAYVANSGSNTVSVINTGTKKVTATVTGLPNGPIALAVTPNGAFVYAANNLAQSVSVISTTTDSILATVPVGDHPIGVAISPDNSWVYVTNNVSGTISVIRTADNVVVNTITLSPGIWTSAVSTDGHWLYVPQYNAGNGNLISVIDTASQAVVASIVVGTGPWGVAFSQDSNYAYVSNSDGTAMAIDTASRTLMGSLSIPGELRGIGVVGAMKVSTVAGGYLGDGGAPTAAALDAPFNTVQDKKGNYYITDRYKHRIRKITKAGKITTFAGTGICGYNGDNIAAKKAMLCYPAGLIFDSAGNLYLGDASNNRVRKIDTKGTITTVAGTGVYGYGGDGGPATSALLGNPWSFAFDKAGNLYFSEITNNIVRKLDKSGTISTFAGTGVAGFSGDGGPATSATMYYPRAIGFDTGGNLFIADANNRRVRIVDTTGTINTFAGTGLGGCTGDGGPPLSARIGTPRGIVIKNGVLYIAAGGCGRVRTIDLNAGLINTIAGSSAGYDGDNNPPLSSRFNAPSGPLFDSVGNMFITDTVNGRVRLYGGLVTTVFGGFLGDGNLATSAALVGPEAMAIDKANNLYIADWYGNRIRKVSGGRISTIAGTGVNGYSGDGGPATSAQLFYPDGVAVDSTGNVFIADEDNGVIRKVDTTGTITTFAADPNFCDLNRMATDAANNLYLADECTSVIFKITPAGVVSIVAGVPFTYGYNGDGILATDAQLNSPYGVAVDNNGNILIADTYNSRLRLVDLSGVIHTIAGDGNCNYTGDGGAATVAEICNPYSIAVSKSGTIYFPDYAYSRVRQVSGGIITAFAGTGFGSGTVGFNGDGIWPLFTMFDDPVDVAVDSQGAVYVVDDVEHRVRKIQ